MKIFTTAQVRQLDQYTCRFEPIDSIDLMERASQRFTQAFVREISPDRRIFVFAGPGNNGGDALAIARLLAAQNYSLAVYLFDSKDKLSIECRMNKLQILSLNTLYFYEINAKIPFIDIKRNDIVIDGLWGSGLNQPITGLAADLIHLINRSEAKIYAIDIPSGLQGENNEGNIPANIIKAFRTFTFHSPKLAFLLPDSAPYTGDWTVLDIGLHPEGVRQMETPFYLTEKENIAPLIRRRSRFAYKNTFGHALVVAGSRGKMGAAVLAAKACLRSGAGLATVHLPACGETIVQTAVPEAMIRTDREKDFIAEVDDLESFSSIGIGPGIGTSPLTQLALEKLLRHSNKPMVLDADALNILSLRPEWMKLIPENSILTPHVGELDRLSGKSSSAYERLEKARRMAAELRCILVLKGAFTAVCLPDGTVHFNSSGNPGMATAGSGDVLTGLLTGLLAQSYPPAEAAIVGVFLHGCAGDRAAEKLSQHSLMAGDIIDFIGEAFGDLKPEP